MKFKNKEAEKLWLEGVQNNQDSYGKAGYDFALSWANAMEERMEAGAELMDIAKELSHEVNTDGITGFLYGCAVGVLSDVWKFGETLRQWHNLDIQIGNEGEKANESGGVLNPALMNINV